MFHGPYNKADKYGSINQAGSKTKQIHVFEAHKSLTIGHVYMRNPGMSPENPGMCTEIPRDVPKPAKENWVIQTAPS